MSIQAQVARDRERHPERFCPGSGERAGRCLWRRTGDGGYCPRCAPAPRGEHEFVRDVVQRIRAYGMGDSVDVEALVVSLAPLGAEPMPSIPHYVVDVATGERTAL